MGQDMILELGWKGGKGKIVAGKVRKMHLENLSAQEFGGGGGGGLEGDDQE